MKWFQGSKEEVLAKVGANYPLGLTKDNAQELLATNGKNELAGKKRKSIFLIFWSQLTNWLIAILIIASIITFFLGEYIDAIIILIVIAINAILGTIQELKAEKAILGLQKYVALQAIVQRDGLNQKIPASDLVVGDLVILEPGIAVGADLRLITAALLQVDESALTGESVPVEKDADVIIDSNDIALGDCKNLVFMSTIVTNGTGIGVAVAVGMSTEIGKIAHLLNVAPRVYTPLELRLNKLGKNIGLMAVGACLLIFGIGILQHRNVADMFLTAVSLAVAAVPEGLSAIVAIVLAVGVTKMAKQKAIVKKLAAVETLGSVNVICTDKTGTLTENKMTVTNYFLWDNINKITEEEHTVSEDLQLMLNAFVICSNATYKDNKGIGDPTEIALHIFYDEFADSRLAMLEQIQRIAEFPFDAVRKSMSVLVQDKEEYIVYTKGAIVRLLEVCSLILIEGKQVQFTETHKTRIKAVAALLSDDALRTLGVAYKIVPQKIDAGQLEQDLVFVGIVGMYDPPREAVKPVIALAKNAGIRVVMITGDHKNTAFAIAQNLGIANSINEVMSGPDFDKISAEQSKSVVNNIAVFARVSPEHKVNIVNAFKLNGDIVAMTGDGVNDAPSLSAADIGIAMGKSGTDVARSAADIILTDDNFETIIKAVEKGRNIYQNIKKSILFLLACNLGEVIAVFITILIGWYPPFIATQLLWINLITDSLPALALGLDTTDKRLMQQKPRHSKEQFLSGVNKWQVIIGGLAIGLAAIVAFWYGCYSANVSPFEKNISKNTIEYARTLSFMVIIVAQLLFALSVRSGKYSFFKYPIWKNKLLIFSILFGFAIQLFILFIPQSRSAFHLQLIQPNGWAIVAVLGIMPFIITELFKLVFYRRTNEK